MSQLAAFVPERLRLVATNPMRIAGLQGVYGDPCGIELIPATLSEALCLNLQLDRKQPPVILIDAGSVSPLFEALYRFRCSCPRALLIVIGTDADDTYIECVISAGAKGFLSANALPEEFLQALESVQEGSIWAPRKVLSRLAGKRSNDRGSSQNKGITGVPLTPRESEVLKLLTGGQGNREIGEHLGIDLNTVKAHLARIMRKAGVGNRIELTMFALHGPYGDPPDRSGSDPPN
jgi:DNA-binding NarL/FixJ family response regulator